VITAFDSGDFIPTDDEIQEGWEHMGFSPVPVTEQEWDETWDCDVSCASAQEAHSTQTASRASRHMED
jgi:hypothetical protein